MGSGGAAPRVTCADHLRVAWLLVRTLLGGLPFLIYLPLFPFFNAWLKHRARRRLKEPAPQPAEPPPPDAAACAGATVFVVAGEASGDALAARVIRRARELCPDLRVRGYGGPALTAAGARLDRDILGHAVVGLLGVLRSLGTWWGLCAETLARLREDPPDVLFTVDFPGLNVRLAQWAKARGVRTVHLVAPKIWAHTPWRIHRWRRAVDLVLGTFPFEVTLLGRSGLRTLYVGHPLFEAPLPAPRGAGPWPQDGPARVELWPGSRRREIERTAAVLVEAAAEIESRRPGVVFPVCLAKAEQAELFRHHARHARWRPQHLELRTGPSEGDAPLLGALACSGTATAELAVDRVPVEVFYRIGLFEWILGHMLVTAPYFALANLVVGRRIVGERAYWAPGVGERIAHDFLGRVGDAEGWQRMQADLAEVRQRLETPHVATRAAGWLLAETAAQRKGAVAAPGVPASPAGGPS